MLKINAITKKHTSIGISVLFIVTAAIGAFVWHQSTNAVTGGLSFEHFATHPYASKTGYDTTSTNYYTGEALCTDGRNFCPAGQLLKDMGFTADGQLVAGYGDWGSNVDSFGVAEGGVYVVPLDVATNTWGNSPLRAGSEALDNIREIDGALYIPTTDPSDKTATGQPGPGQSGYITNEGGTWRFVNNNAGNVHTFDVAKLEDKGIWTFGSNDWNGDSRGVASSHVSTDNGATWNWSTIDDSTPGDATDWERYYWGVAVGEKLYTHAAHIIPSRPPYKVYDNDSWQTASNASAQICDVNLPARLVVTFDNHIVCPGDNGLMTFDGTSSSPKPLGSNYGVKDFYVKQNVMYILTGSNKIYMLSNLDQEPVFIGSAGAEAASAQTLAVYDDYMYLGGEGGEIWRSSTTMSEAPEVVITPTIDTVLPFAVTLSGGEKTIVIQGSDFGVDPTVKINGQLVQVVSANDESITVTFDVNQFEQGSVPIEVTHKDGYVATKENALQFVLPSADVTPSITAVSAEPRQGGEVQLNVSGTALTSARDNDYWSVGMRKKLVKVNGVDLAACASNEAYGVLKNYYDEQYFTQATPCYKLIDYNVATNTITPLMSSGGLTIMLPAGHDAALHGTVRINGGAFSGTTLNVSNTFTY